MDEDLEYILSVVDSIKLYRAQDTKDYYAEYYYWRGEHYIFDDDWNASLPVLLTGVKAKLKAFLC